MVRHVTVKYMLFIYDIIFFAAWIVDCSRYIKVLYYFVLFLLF